jgi:hypothetical protein
MRTLRVTEPNAQFIAAFLSSGRDGAAQQALRMPRRRNARIKGLLLSCREIAVN